MIGFGLIVLLVAVVGWLQEPKVLSAQIKEPVREQPQQKEAAPETQAVATQPTIVCNDVTCLTTQFFTNNILIYLAISIPALFIIWRISRRITW